MAPSRLIDATVRVESLSAGENDAVWILLDREADRGFVLETRWSRAIGADFRKGVSTMEKPKGFGPLALPESNATSYPMA